MLLSIKLGATSLCKVGLLRIENKKCCSLIILSDLYLVIFYNVSNFNYILSIWFRKLIGKLSLVPSDRQMSLQDTIQALESSIELGPCGGFTVMYKCLCDFYNLPFRDEVAWVTLLFLLISGVILNSYVWCRVKFLCFALRRIVLKWKK